MHLVTSSSAGFQLEQSLITKFPSLNLNHTMKFKLIHLVTATTLAVVLSGSQFRECGHSQQKISQMIQLEYKNLEPSRRESGRLFNRQKG